jgi:hypothetical protein
MNETVGAGKDDKGREFTIYWEFIYSFTQIFLGKGLDRTKAKKVKIRDPSPTLPAYPLHT